MPLLPPDTKVSTATMRGMFRELMEGLPDLRERLEHPPAEITAPHRLQTARGLLDDVIEAAAALDLEKLPKDPLRAWVNILYDVSLVSVEYLKTCTKMPQVPPPRR